MLGVVDDLLVDRAFVEQRRNSALELATIADVSPAGPAQRRQRAGRGRTGPLVRGARHRGPRRAAQGQGGRAQDRDDRASTTGIRWIDDSKATNPHAADAALRAFD